MERVLFGLGLAASLMAAEAGAGGPTPAMLAHPCGGCHGTLGAAQGPTIPILAGMPKEYIAEAMRGFRSGTRPATIMDRIAKGYSNAEMEAIGEFFGALEFAPVQQKTDPTLVARGKELHNKHCKKCHQDNGRDFQFKEAPGPIIGGQWLEYLYLAMNEMMGRERDMPQQMGEAFLKLTGPDVDALVHFYASQK